MAAASSYAASSSSLHPSPSLGGGATVAAASVAPSQPLSVGDGGGATVAAQRFYITKDGNRICLDDLPEDDAIRTKIERTIAKGGNLAQRFDNLLKMDSGGAWEYDEDNEGALISVSIKRNAFALFGNLLMIENSRDRSDSVLRAQMKQKYTRKKGNTPPFGYYFTEPEGQREHKIDSPEWESLDILTFIVGDPSEDEGKKLVLGREKKTMGTDEVIKELKVVGQMIAINKVPSGDKKVKDGDRDDLPPTLDSGSCSIPIYDVGYSSMINAVGRKKELKLQSVRVGKLRDLGYDPESLKAMQLVVMEVTEIGEGGKSKSGKGGKSKSGKGGKGLQKDQERAKKRQKKTKSAQDGAALPPIPMEEIDACAEHAEGGDLPLFDEGYDASVYAQESVGKTEDVTEEI